MPSHYAIEQPGVAPDVSVKVEGVPLVEIKGLPTYHSDTRLLMTTVSIYGGPERQVYPLQALSAWVRPEAVAIPSEAFYPVEASREEIDKISTMQMLNSQDMAAAAGLQAAGYEVPKKIVVADLPDDVPAAKHLKVDDELIAITTPDGVRTEIAAFKELRALFATIAPDTEITVELCRGGKEENVSFPTIAPSDGRDGSLMGILVFQDVDLPTEVNYAIDGIGGPSAGMIFALRIYDELTAGSLGQAETIAGTGTIDADGAVGPIGGIRLKMIGAHNSGARYFLAPEENCAEVIGHIPDGMQVVPVDTLDDAIKAAEAMGKSRVADLPTCQQVVDEGRGVPIDGR